MPSSNTNRLQGLTTSVAVKPPCVTVSTSNITLSGLQTVNGVAVVEGDRVLVAAQTTGSQNGIYVASTGDWTRALDFDGDLDAVSGTRVLIRTTGSAGIEYELTTANPITIGTTSLTFVQRYGANAVYDQTAAEIAAPITPVNEAYTEFDPRRYTANIDSSDFVTNRNVGWGYQAFQLANPGVLNVAVGYRAMYRSTTGGGGLINAQGCVAIGAEALGGAVHTGDYNIAIGYTAMNLATSAYCNVGIGLRSLSTLVSGQYNTAVGCDSLKDNTANDNTACGAKALISNTSGTPNTAVGASALYNNLTGANNVALGVQAMETNTSGGENVAIGNLALNQQAINSFCTAVGHWALRLNTAATNTAIGHKSMQVNTTGTGNTAVGNQSLDANQTGGNNTAVGYGALLLNVSGNQGTAVGLDALRASTGGLNVGVGYFAGRATTSGINNVFVGRQAGSGNTTGSFNTAIGDSCGDAATVANNNTSVGYDAGGSLTGSNNTIVGVSALNTETTGTNNTAVGYQAGATQSGFSNTTTLGNGANASASNQVTLGNSSIATLRCQVTTITALSDERFKKNVTPLDIPDAFLDEVEIVAFEWIAEGMPQGRQVGVIAQQLDALQEKYGLQWLGLVDKCNPDQWEATPFKLFFPLIVKTQRLARRVAALEATRAEETALLLSQVQK